MGIGFILGRGMPMSGEFQMIMLFVNATFLVIITHFLLEIYSGNRVLEVVDVTPRGHLHESFAPANEAKTAAKKTKKSTKKATKKKKAKKR